MKTHILVLVVALSVAMSDGVTRYLPMGLMRLPSIDHQWMYDPLAVNRVPRGHPEIIFENTGEAVVGAFNTAKYSDPDSQRVDRLVRRALGDFSLRMEATQQRGDNVVFSPLSIVSALAIVLLGARGVTKDEVAHMLGVNAGIDLTGKDHAVHEGLGRLLDTLEKEKSTADSYVVRIARALFLQEGFKINATFVNRTLELYHSEIQRVDFSRNPMAALHTVNKWVGNRTENHIKSLLTKVPDAETKVVIATALYFNGQWENPFYQNATKLKPFYIGRQGGTNQNEVVDVELMVNGAEIPYHADESLACTIIGMPYKGNQLTMYVIVPDGDVKTFLDSVSSTDLEKLVKKTTKRPVIFFFPRMHLQSTIDLVHPLKKMGLNSLFDAQTSNLSNIAEGIFVNEAVHKVDIEVTEEGTVASAATAFTFTRDGSNPVVRVDKPFVFFIQDDNTGIILFWGTVIRPTPNYKQNS